MKQIFENEGKMQSWLSDWLLENDDFREVITNIDYVESYKSANLCDRKIAESFNYCLKSLEIVEVLSENENISLNPSDSLKPDFLLYAPETESIVIVELKNIEIPSRQAGTEVSAYANEVKSYIPFVSDGDIINVIVSCHWPTLLRHYVFHEIFWLNRNILCLRPVTVNDEVKLEIINVAEISEDLTMQKFSTQHLSGYQICLYDDNLYSNPLNFDRFDLYLNQMKTALAVIASKANGQKSHGFAFLWKDNLRDMSLSPYNITIVNISPFQAFERHFHKDKFETNDLSKKIIESVITEHDPTGQGGSLLAITLHGQKFLENFCSPTLEGFLNWDSLKEVMLRRVDKHISFECWGLFEEIYGEKLVEAYNNGQTHVGSNDSEFGLKMLDEIIDINYEHIDLSNYCRFREDGDEEY